jgi:hypothetical protein
MVNLEIKFAEQMQIISDSFEKTFNFFVMKKAMLELVRNPIFKEYLEYINFNKVMVTPPSYKNESYIQIYFDDPLVSRTIVEHPRSVTRALFDNSKYLKFQRMMLLKRVTDNKNTED